MVNSIAKVAAAAALACTGGVKAQETVLPAPCSLSFESTSLNAQTNTGVFRGIRLSCERVAIAADEATASEVLPESGEWQMRGNIRVETDSAVITAQSATFGFSDNGLVFGDITGNPVVLEDFAADEDGAVRTRATAGRIYYDNTTRTARLEDGASLTFRTGRMSGCGDIIYNLDSGEVDSVSDCGEPFVIIMRPRDEERPAEPDAAPR